MRLNPDTLSETKDAMGDQFAICDALLWEPASGYLLLDYHLQRLERSAAHFGFPVETDNARERLLEYGRQLPKEPRKVRLKLGATGAIALENELVRPSTAVAVVLSQEAVDSRDEFLRHKTTRREVYNRALAACPEAQDVILWNERGELTETCQGNLVLEIEARRLTPPLSSGLLAGVFRAHLLDRGEVQEQTLRVSALESASRVWMINSVRKWCELRLLRGACVAGGFGYNQRPHV